MLALLVLASHAFSLWPDAGSVSHLSLGNVGVFLFFVLSGFVITEALEEFYSKRIGNFLLNRFFKIYPPYWVALALAITVDVLTGDIHPSLYTVTGLSGNILLFGQYLGITNFSQISITWAVVVEIQFYLAMAVCFVLIRKVRKDIVLTAFSLVGLFGYLAVLFTDTRLRIFGTLEFAPYFILGAWLYYLRMESNKKLSLLFVVLSAALAMHAFITYVSRGSQVNTVGAVILFVAVFSVFLYLLWVPTDWMNIALDKYLGNATYFLYLIHMPVVTLFERWEMVSGLMAFILAVLTSILLALVLYRVIEMPIQCLRDRVRGQRLYI